MQHFGAGTVLEEIDVSGVVDSDDAIAGEFDVDEIGWFGSSLVKSVGKAVSSVTKSPIFQATVGVVAIAFPAVGIPTAIALEAAHVAVKAANTGAAAAAQLNAKLGQLKAAAAKGDQKAQNQVNAIQLVLAARKAKAAGLQRLRPVAIPGKGSFSTTPVPLARLKSNQVPTSLYAPATTPAQLAVKLAAGGSQLGKTVLAAVAAGKAVAVPNGVAVVPGQRPVKYAHMWIGRAPVGMKARLLKGAHAVTRGGYVVTGQSIFVA